MSPSTIRITVVSVGLFLLSAAAFIFMVWQTQLQDEKLAVQVDTLNEQRSQEESYFRLRRIAEESQQNRDQLRTYFFSGESESINFLNYVENIAPRAGVELQTTSLNLIDGTEAGQQWVEVGFIFEGSRNRVTSFLSILEALPHVSQITTFNMSATTQSRWRGEVTMRIRILNYDE